MKFEITLELRKTTTVEVDADSRDVALAMAEASNPDMSATGIACGEVEHELIGKCEGCTKPIWEGDDYRSDEDGVIVCMGCADDGDLSPADPKVCNRNCDCVGPCKMDPQG